MTHQSTTISIGGLPLTLSSPDVDFCELLRKRYAHFAHPADTDDHSIDLELRPPTGLPGSTPVVRAERTGQVWKLSRGDFEAEWDPKRRCGHVRLAATPYAVDTFLRVVHSLVLAEGNGFLLHSSSAVRNGRAFLFTGVSGAGKTTVSRLAPPDALLLTDEISYVRLQDNRYYAYGTPFSGELNQLGRDISAPIAAAYLLAQGPENQIEPVSSAEAVRRLMRNVLFFAHDPQLTRRVFATVCDFVSRVPVSRLTFIPEPRVWELIG